MIRRFTTCLLLCSSVFLWSSCDDDEVSAPPQSSLSADKTSGRANDTEFTFTIDQVDADAIALLPYGTDNENLGGVLVTSFQNGKATVKFTYAQVGTFQAVVATNNHTADGESIRTTYSDPVTITITSDRNEISEFTFEKSTKTEIDQGAKTITVTVPYGTDVTSLKARFTASPFATVKVGGAAQTTDVTTNDFTNPVTYTVEADEGNAVDYLVTVNVTPVETTNTVKSFGGKVAGAVDKDKVLPAAVDNTNRIIVVYNEFGTPAEVFDSIRVTHEVDGAFSYIKYGDEKLAQDSLLNLTSPKEIDVYSQDSLNAGGIATYTVYAAEAPKLSLAFNGLIPNVTGTNDGFTITLKVLAGTDVSSIVTTSGVDLPDNVTMGIDDIKIDGVTFHSGDPVDYSQDVDFELTVTDNNIGVTYTVVYTVSVLILN